MERSSNPAATERPRRGFLTACAAALGGLGALLLPAGAGVWTFLEPWRRRSGAASAIRVARLDALPADGTPRRFPVIANRVNAWNLVPAASIGAVFLSRTGDQTVRALNVICPHAGCFVDYLGDRGAFHCPCHESSFGLDGSVKDPSSPSPRPLDSLEVEIRNGGEVWVKFQNFQPGHKDKRPVG
jgi:Rieske Fe-S protein